MRARYLVAVLLSVVVAVTTAGGCAPKGRHADDAVWSAPEPEVVPGTALATAQAFLEAACKGDWEAVDALFLVPREGRAEEYRAATEELMGAWTAHHLVSSESGMDLTGWPNFPGGEGACVYAVVSTVKVGDLEIAVGLGREGGTGPWGMCFFKWGVVAADGSIGPPIVDLPPEALVPLASSAERPKTLEEYDDVVLEAALTWQQNRGALPIIVSPKVELAFVVAGLTGEAPEFCGSGGTRRTPLGKKALSFFEAYKDHPAVTYMAFLERQGFRYDAVGSLALRFSDPPTLEPEFPIGDYLVGRSYGWGRADQERRLLEAVELERRFAVEADFASYLEATQEDYDRLVAMARTNIPPGLPDTLENYFGTRHDAYVVVVSGLSGSYGGMIEDGDWACLTAIVTFEPEYASSVWMTVAHEWCHSFVNPVLAAHNDLVQSYAGLFDDRMREAMSSQAYGNWETALNEHVIRAVTARLIGRSDQAMAERVLANDEQKGFAYVRALYQRLAEYEADREKYPTFESFLPRLLEALGEPG